VGRKIRVADIFGVFRGSEAVAAGVLTADQLRGPQFRRLYRDVYLPAAMPVTHPVCCEGIALALPAASVITGRSAATLRGIPLARATDPVEIVAPLETQIARRSGVDVRRTDVASHEKTQWSRIGLATPLRMSLDLILDRALPDAVADLDAVLRTGLIDLGHFEGWSLSEATEVSSWLAARSSLLIRGRSLGRSHGCGCTWCSPALSRNPST
jgi:hypothetical protein